MLRGLKQTLCTPGPRDLTETETELCLSVSCRGSGQQWTARGQGLWVQQAWVWHKSLWRLPLTHHRATRTYTGLGKQTLGGHKQNCAYWDPGKRAVTPQETDPDLPVSVQESLAEVWVSHGLLQHPGH